MCPVTRSSVLPKFILIYGEFNSGRSLNLWQVLSNGRDNATKSLIVWFSSLSN